MNYFKLILMASCLGLMTNVYADNVNNTPDLNTAPHNTSVNNTENIAKAMREGQAWGLTVEEWAQYQQLMQGKFGQWYPQLTPPAILGLAAKTSQEQERFAMLVAQEEHDKLARELAFNNAVHQAMLKLYVHEPVIKPFDMSAYNPQKHG